MIHAEYLFLALFGCFSHTYLAVHIPYILGDTFYLMHVYSLHNSMKHLYIIFLNHTQNLCSFLTLLPQSRRCPSLALDIRSPQRRTHSVRTRKNK